MLSTESVQKAAKKILKNHEGTHKLKELTKLVVKALLPETSDDDDGGRNNKKSAKKVKQIIQEGSSLFKIDGKHVSLVKKEKKHKLATITDDANSSNDTDVPTKKIKTTDSSSHPQKWRATKDRKSVV